MKLKASIGVATLAISLTVALGAQAENCPTARQSAQRAGLPVIVEEYYPHSDRTAAPVNADYTQPNAAADDYGFPDFNYDPIYYDNPYTAAYGLGGYGVAPYGYGGFGPGRGWGNDRSWDNDRGGGHSRVSPGRSALGRGGMVRR